MEISERELRRMVADSDDQHRAAMSTFTEDNRAHPGAGSWPVWV